MTEHMQLSDLKTYCKQIQAWLNARYGAKEGQEIWEKVSWQYEQYLKDLPDYGGKKAGHASAIYGGLLVFSVTLCRSGSRLAASACPTSSSK